MTDWFSTNRKPTDPMILVGDLNIAPLECDVWSHKQLLKVVSHTPIEVDHLNRLMSASDWIDTARYLTPEPKKLFTWWSYRSREWRTANKGRRLDHIWVTPLLKQKIVDSGVLRDARGWEKPSDHAPVTTDLGQF
jgi:exodeoxyribonuclease-3